VAGFAAVINLALGPLADVEADDEVAGLLGAGGDGSSDGSLPHAISTEDTTSPGEGEVGTWSGLTGTFGGPAARIGRAVVAIHVIGALLDGAGVNVGLGSGNVGATGLAESLVAGVNGAGELHAVLALHAPGASGAGLAGVLVVLHGVTAGGDAAATITNSRPLASTITLVARVLAVVPAWRRETLSFVDIATEVGAAGRGEHDARADDAAGSGGTGSSGLVVPVATRVGTACRPGQGVALRGGRQGAVLWGWALVTHIVLPLAVP